MMRSLSSLAAWRCTFLAGLGVLTACGGETGSHAASGGSGGTPSGQGGSTGGQVSEGSGGHIPPGTGGQGSATGGMATTSGGAGSGGASPSCANPTPVLTRDGKVTGLETCQDGLIHRPSAIDCAQGLPREDVFYGDTWGGTCDRDSDCSAAAYGYCEPVPGQIQATVCNYGCVSDADCPAGSLCECGPRFGVCTPTNCATDTDCGDELCAKNVDAGGCSDGFGGPQQFACTTASDSCRVDADCTTHRCAYAAGARSCAPQDLCGIGRPFLVNGAPRSAAIDAGDSWLLPSARPAKSTPNAQVTLHYQRAALLEHASIAAFARFTLELLALGAPAELIEASTQAMADETLHARLCFGLASRYAGRALGPGPLAVSDALGSADLDRILEGVVLEGCIGEAIAAEEARQALALATDPEVCAALTRIARDERGHAELAFRFVAWALGQKPELAETVRSLVARELLSAAAPASSAELLPPEARDALEHGVFPDCWRSALRAQVLREFVLPCIDALCRRHGPVGRGEPRARVANSSAFNGPFANPMPAHLPALA